MTLPAWSTTTSPVRRYDARCAAFGLSPPAGIGNDIKHQNFAPMGGAMEKPRWGRIGRVMRCFLCLANITGVSNDPANETAPVDSRSDEPAPGPASRPLHVYPERGHERWPSLC